jgi:hypothetical protein
MKHSFKDNYDTINNVVQFRQFWRELYVGSPADTGQHRLIFGHTHYQAVHYLSNQELWLNPGSASYRPTRQSDDFTQDAHYMAIEDGTIKIKQVEYDLTPLFAAVQNVRLKEKHIQAAHRFFKKSE